jgi:asparagine synthetase B (glutamine-hydrolysing)
MRFSAGTPGSTIPKRSKRRRFHGLPQPAAPSTARRSSTPISCSGWTFPNSADSYAQAIAETPVYDGEDALERRMREISYLHLTRFVQFLLDRKDRMSMAVGLEVRVPFCDHRLVE